MPADIDLRDHLRPGDTVVIGQGTAELRSLAEALIEQRHDLAPLTVFVGASFTGLFQPEHADAFHFTGSGGSAAPRHWSTPVFSTCSRSTWERCQR